MQGSQAENVLSYGARVPISEQTYSWIVVHICDKLPLQQWILCLFIESRTLSIERVRVGIYFG